MTDQQKQELDVERRRLQGEINLNPGSREDLEAKHGQVWDSTEVARDFLILGFGAPCVVVKRRSDGVVGSLMFQHAPRLYWGFVEDSDLGGSRG